MGVNMAIRGNRWQPGVSTVDNSSVSADNYVTALCKGHAQLSAA